MTSLSFACTYVMPVVIGLMFTGIIVKLQFLSNEN